MVAVPNQPLMSEEEYLKSSSEPECEYLEGILEPKAVPDYTHGRLEALLGAFFVGQEERFGFKVVDNARIKVKERRFRLPDISVLAKRPSTTRFADEPPLITIEVVSPGEPWAMLRAKVRDHHEMGVLLVIVADPHSREVFVAREDGLLHQVPPPPIVSLDIPGKGSLDINFAELFARLD